MTLPGVTATFWPTTYASVPTGGLPACNPFAVGQDVQPAE